MKFKLTLFLPLCWLAFGIICIGNPTSLFCQSLDKENLKKTRATNQPLEEELIGGIINISNLKIGFLNNGRFCPPAEFIPELPGALFGDYGYLRVLDLWIGIPDGPWAPQVWNVDSQKYVSQGPTVSGTCFKNSNTDWSTISMTQDVFYTTQLLYSDIYKPSALFDFILAPTSDYELTWPRNPFTGFREWPGRWKKDSLTGKPMKGVFFGDQDIFISFDDKANSYQNEGYFIGAEVLAQVVGFQEGSVSNMVIFDLQIINTSQFNYFDAYIGIYYRAGHPWYYLAEKPDRNLIKTGYIKNEQSIGTKEHLQYNLSYSYNYNNPIIHASFTDSTHFGVQFLKTPFAEDDQTDNDDDGVIDEQGEELGLTGWHFIPWESIIYFQNNERLQYQILAGDSTGIDKSWLNKILFFTDSLGNLDPNFDSSDRVTDRKHPFGPGLINRYTSNLLSCGPVNWASGDTLNFIFAILVADDIDALKASARMARKIIDRNYHYSGSPPPPKVTAVAQDGKVTLYWDRSAENAIDFLTGYQDFEGYKIYRTESDPANNEWGQPNYDDKGNFINFIPIDRCDLDNGINGYETVYPHQFLGDDTGLFHTWTDTTVTNGITYWYSVCSYDHGIISDEKFNPDHYPISPMNECPKGIDPERDVNLVKLIFNS